MKIICFLRQKSCVAVLAVLLLMSCRAHFIAEYDMDLARQITSTSKMVDGFYLKMQETTKAGSRPYKDFASQYVDVEVELNSLLMKNKVKALNQNSVRICEIALTIWDKYKEEHKKSDNVSDGIINFNRKYMSDLFYAMQVAEEGKKLGASTPAH